MPAGNVYGRNDLCGGFPQLGAGLWRYLAPGIFADKRRRNFTSIRRWHFFWSRTLSATFGDHFWVEKLYSALTAMATIAVVIAVWRQLAGRQSALAEYGWLPILLWAMFKHWSWQYGNNFLENTVCVFATLAVYAVLQANDNPRILSGWIVLAAVCTLGAVLSKGPVGLFPLITPIVAGATVHRKNWNRAWLASFVLLALFCAMFGLVLLNAHAREFFSRYLQQQVIASLQGVHGNTTSWGHFYILKTMTRDLRFPAAVAFVFVLIDYMRNRTKALTFGRGAQSNPALRFCLAMAVAASLPIMLSPKQWSHYTYPSYPFYSLALAFWCVPAVRRVWDSPGLSTTKWAQWVHPALRTLAIYRSAGGWRRFIWLRGSSANRPGSAARHGRTVAAIAVGNSR